MKKYMFVIPTLSLGGAERVISVLGTALSNDREVTILKYYDTSGEYAVGERVKIINLSEGDETAYRKIGYLQKVKKIRNIIKNEKPDFVIPFLFHVALCVAISTFWLRAKVLQSIRIDPASSPTSKINRFLRDHMVRRAKCTFVQNEKQKQYFSKKIHSKIHVLYNPVYEKLFECNPKPSDGFFTVCTMGRVEEQKNFPMLIDAFEKAFADLDSARLLIYGKGSQTDKIQNYIDSKGLDSKVKMMGRTDDVISVYEKVDLFVLSSDFEGMPNALIEAMAAGVPCISTDCPTGPSDLITDGENGLLVPVGDMESMVKAMQRMASDEFDKAAMTQAARQTIIEKCSPQKIAEKMINICETL